MSSEGITSGLEAFEQCFTTNDKLWKGIMITKHILIWTMLGIKQYTSSSPLLELCESKDVEFLGTEIQLVMIV